MQKFESNYEEVLVDSWLYGITLVMNAGVDSYKFIKLYPTVIHLNGQDVNGVTLKQQKNP